MSQYTCLAEITASRRFLWPAIGLCILSLGIFPTLPHGMRLAFCKDVQTFAHAKLYV